MSKKVDTSDLIPRLVVAIVGIPILFLAAFKGPNWGLWVIVFGAGLIGTHEMLAMCLKRDFGGTGWVAFALTSATLASLYWADDPIVIYACAFVSLIGILFSSMFTARSMEHALQRAQSALLACVYSAILFGGYLLLFRHAPRTETWEFQAGWFLFPMFIIWAGDTGAYFAGRFFGKRKLIPSVSPGKSWEGAIGGVIWSVFFGYVAWYFMLQEAIPVWLVPAYVVPAAIFGQLGDLAESMIKRGSGNKDSGTILYGHGGMLDRVDGLIVAVPYIYILREVLPPTL